MDIGVTISKVRKEYKEYLRETHPDWADTTISTHVSDAFYLYQNTIALSFWKCFESDAAMEKAKGEILDYLKQEVMSDRADERTAQYYRDLKRLKEFIDSKGGVKTYIGYEYDCEVIVYKYAKMVYDGTMEMDAAVKAMCQDVPCFGETSHKLTIMLFASMMKGVKYTRRSNTETTVYFIVHIGKDYGQEQMVNALKATQVIRKKQLVCNYDEFSVDAYPNRIIKTTMDLLLRGSISKARKKEIRKLMIFFDGISILDIHSINWDIQYDRNNQTYRMLIAVCRFVIKGLLQTTADGSTKIMDYADDQTMAKLYEKFILGYYQREHPELKAYSPQITWQVTDGYRTLLPTMQSDIVITNKAAKKTLIIDAKYYTHNMQMKAPYMTQTLHSGNLYQIFTYVKNWSAAPDEVVSGMLLYAGTDDAIQPNNDYQMSGNQISVKTLDMDCDFSKIAAQLDSIADRIK